MTYFCDNCGETRIKVVAQGLHDVGTFCSEQCSRSHTWEEHARANQGVGGLCVRPGCEDIPMVTTHPCEHCGRPTSIDEDSLDYCSLACARENMWDKKRSLSTNEVGHILETNGFSEVYNEHHS